MPPDTFPADGWDGPQFALLLHGALAHLEREAPVMNVLNVFPVPDGDTGTNMTATLRAALAELSGNEAGPGDVARVVAHGALMGARGNGGVILSQLLRGLARGLEGHHSVTGTVLAAALRQAADISYRAVTTPVEGTMLTVAREAAEAAETVGSSGAPSATAVLEAALAAARQSLARTPDLLPVLREAGVVDAGGHGIVAILEGALRVARGQSPVEGESPALTQTVDARWAANADRLHHRVGSSYGYCTEFIVRGNGLHLDQLTAAMAPHGDSLLVVGDEDMAHVHIHALDPGAPLSAALQHGALLQIKIDNMEEQSQRFLHHDDQPSRQAEVPDGKTRPVGVVAVVAGEGLAAVARSLGATVVPGGQSMNPSAADLLAGAEQSCGETVILLPNNRNVLMTAQQAAGLAGKRALVVPTTTVPQGLAALLALPPDATPEEAVAVMTRAAAAVLTVEVTRASRTTNGRGLRVRKGQALALADGIPMAAGATFAEVVSTALARVDTGQVQLVTVYTGADADDGQTAKVVEAVHTRLPHADVEVVPGGQPHYPYLLALE